VSKGNWRIENGELVGIGAGGGVDAWIYAGDTTWRDYALSAKIVFVTGNAELVLRSTGHWQNEYRVELWSQESTAYTNCFQVSRYKDGVGKSFTDNTPSPLPITNPVLVRAEVVGNAIFVFINGRLLFNYTDSTPLLAGRFGLGVVWNWSGRFDDVSVEQITRSGQPLAEMHAPQVGNSQNPRKEFFPKSTISEPRDPAFEFRDVVGYIWNRIYWLDPSQIVLGVGLMVLLVLCCCLKRLIATRQKRTSSDAGPMENHSNDIVVDMVDVSGARRRANHGKNFCSHCGAPAPSVKYCPNCGAAQ